MIRYTLLSNLFGVLMRSFSFFTLFLVSSLAVGSVHAFNPIKKLNKWYFDSTVYLPRCSVEVTSYVHNVLQELGVDDYEQVSVFNDESEFENGSCITAGWGARAIFLHEDFFKGLPDEQKRGLIAHEGMHLLENHGMKQVLAENLLMYPLCVGLMIPLLPLSYFGKYVPEHMSNKIFVSALVGAGITACFLHVKLTAWLSRYYEYRADAGAVKIGCADGLIDFLMTYVPDKPAHAIDTHPTTRQRIAYLRELIEKQKAQVA